MWPREGGGDIERDTCNEAERRRGTGVLAQSGGAKGLVRGESAGS